MVGGVVEPVCQRQLLRQFRMRSVLYGKYLLHAYGVYLFSVGEQKYFDKMWDMYEYARQVSGYAPSRKIGAIGWADMKVTLRKSGFDCTLNTKPESYEQFQQEIAASQMAVVLVSSRDDDTYWKKTGGHYVSISLYDASSDQVFLGDPADPDGNRSWIPLRYVYDALKTVSQYQYLLVQDYAEEQNQWMHDGITDAWGGM